MSESQGALRAFSQFITQVDNGRLHGELSKEVQDLVAALQDAAGGREKAKGKLTITLDFEFDGKAGLFEIGGDYKVTGPKERRGKSILWSDADNFLTPYNPRQQDMFIRDVSDRSAVRDA